MSKLAIACSGSVPASPCSGGNPGHSWPRRCSRSALGPPAQPAAFAVRSGDFGADRPAWKETLALAEDVAVDPVGRGDLGGGETGRLVLPLGAAWQILRGLESTTKRLRDESVLEAVGSVALGVYPFCEEAQLGGGKGLTAMPCTQ